MRNARAGGPPSGPSDDACMPCSVVTQYGAMADSADWLAKVTFMRENGVTDAEWDESNALVCAKLGPVQSQAAPFQREPEEAETPLARKRRVLLGAAGTLHVRPIDE